MAVSLNNLISIRSFLSISTSGSDLYFKQRNTRTASATACSHTILKGIDTYVIAGLPDFAGWIIFANFAEN